MRVVDLRCSGAPECSRAPAQSGAPLPIGSTTAHHPEWATSVIIPRRLAGPSETPRGAELIRRVAVSNGWSIMATYARGTPDVGSHPGRMIDSLALRMADGTHRAVAIWEDGKFAMAYVWCLDPPEAPLRLNATQLRAHLKG